MYDGFLIAFSSRASPKNGGKFVGFATCKLAAKFPQHRKADTLEYPDYDPR